MSLSGKRTLTSLDGSRVADVDPEGWLVVGDVEHHEIHEGELFVASKIFEDVADNGAVNIVFQNASETKSAHLQMYGSHGGDSYGKFYRNCTHTNGTALSAQQPNGESDTTSECVLSYNGSDGTSGDLALEEYLPGGTKTLAGGGQGSGRVEFVVPAGATVMVEMVNKAGGAKTQSITLIWYEHDPLT